MPPDPLPAPPAVLAAMLAPIAPTPIPPDAAEEQLIGLWLHGKSPNTIRAYRRGLRVSEAVSLQWRNLVDGIVNVRGKGGPHAGGAALAWDVGRVARPAAR